MYSRFITPFVWLLTLFVLLFIYTKLIGPIPFSVNSVNTQKSTTFDVTGTGKAAVKPDMASVTAGIQVQSQSVKAAQEQINSIINKVAGAVKQLEIDPQDIQTTNYNINPTYDYSGGTSRITGYSASTNLLIKVKNLDKINSVIDAATGNGANQISGVSFDISDKSKVENEARQKAVEEAKKKASEAAKVAGFRLGRIINYSENLQGEPRPMPMAVTLDKASGAPTQVEPGSSEVNISVTLSYEIL